ncbi:MAG: GTPase HflX [Planctomycetes bacterium]|nr:GTPase HflX [Planctomycetota bacterium]
MRYSIRSNTPDDGAERRRVPRQTAEPGLTGRPQRAERAVLVSVLLPHTKADLRDPLAELAALAESARVEVVDRMVQKRTGLSPAYALGKGRLEELVQRVQDSQADTVIFDNDLLPRQIRGLEEAVGVKVIDRAELILDIFASRAKTREAQLQVELAQLEYTAPRLRGMWTHLERVAGAGGATAAGAVGGVGTRGPGERQIEIDRRLVQQRISHLKREIAEIDERKQREVRSRADQFTVSLVGYTNSGKSTLMNRLTNAERYAADQLFATLDTKTVRWDLGGGRSALLSDTVGFIRDLPHHLVASFRATLEEAIHADLLLHVVDISAHNAYQQMQSVDEVLLELGCEHLPQVTLLNKLDIADDATMVEMLARHRTDALCISAVTGEGLEALAQMVRERLQGSTVTATVHLPHGDGKLMTEIGRLAHVIERRYLTDGVELDLRMNRTQFLQLRGRHPALSVVRQDGGLHEPPAAAADRA